MSQEQVHKKVDVVNERGQVVDIEDRAKTREELVKERAEVYRRLADS